MLNKIYDPIFNALLLKPNCSNSNELFKTTSYIFLFLMICGFLLNTYNRTVLLLRIKMKTKLVVYILLKILVDAFIVLFMYKACLTCNGLIGLLYMIIFLYIIDSVFYLIFRHLNQYSTKKVIIIK